MRVPMRALIVEDSDDDALLLLNVLQEGGYDVTHARVFSEAGMRAALGDASWDIIISDHRMPGFDALRALSVRAELAPDVPFIVLSGSIGEDVAVDAMRAGASD